MSDHFEDRFRKWGNSLVNTCKAGAGWAVLKTLHSLLFSADWLVHFCWSTIVALPRSESVELPQGSAFFLFQSCYSPASCKLWVCVEGLQPQGPRS